MTPEERKSLAQQLEANPLFVALLEEMEGAAMQGMLHAADDQTRLEAQIRARVTQDFRANWHRLLADKPERKKVA